MGFNDKAEASDELTITVGEVGSLAEVMPQRPTKPGFICTACGQVLESIKATTPKCEGSGPHVIVKVDLLTAVTKGGRVVRAVRL